jgi:predicted amidophosphoribosyltransferase
MIGRFFVEINAVCRHVLFTMPLAKQLKKCPYCAEPINASATRCKHCHADLGGTSSGKPSTLARLDSFRSGFLSGILFCLILAILLYFQFRTP